MAELADASDSKSDSCKGVWVRPPLRAPYQDCVMRKDCDHTCNIDLLSRSAVFLLEVLCCFLGAGAIFASSLVRIRFFPVPFTLQTLAIVLVSIFFGKRRAIGSLLLFILMWGPLSPTTIGYIIGFFAVPFIINQNSRKYGTLKLATRILMSLLMVSFSGMLILAHFVGLKEAFVYGFLFFVPAEILKTVIAVAVIKFCKIRK